MRIRLVLAVLAIVTVLGFCDACLADVTIVNTPSGTNICTSSGSGSIIICY